MKIFFTKRSKNHDVTSLFREFYEILTPSSYSDIIPDDITYNAKFSLNYDLHKFYNYSSYIILYSLNKKEYNYLIEILNLSFEQQNIEFDIVKNENMIEVELTILIENDIIISNTDQLAFYIENSLKLIIVLTKNSSYIYKTDIMLEILSKDFNFIFSNLSVNN